MSARRPRLVLSPIAQHDLRDVLTYSEQQWGKAQRHAYRQRFVEAFAELVTFPELGIARPEYGKDIRSHRVGQHVVIYQPHEAELRIVRVLHARRDLDIEFS